MAPAVMNTTFIENVTANTRVSETTTVSESVTLTTPMILSTTSPGCSALNTSTCETCVPGSYSDNDKVKASLAQCKMKVGSFSLWLDNSDVSPAARVFTPILPAALCVSPAPQAPTATTQAPTPAEAVLQVSIHHNKMPHRAVHVNRNVLQLPSCALCQICPAGTESLQPAAKECTPCRPGMHKAPRQSMCQICSSGFFQIRWGQETCNLCPENHYCPSPDVNPILCPGDAFCPEGSTAPGYCMETFFRKAGEECELAPVTIALLVIGGGALLFVILLVLRRRRDTDGELSLVRQPLLRKERPQGRYYGIPCDAEPVYAGW
uniref:uncharacterized protein LOC124046936 n=1 Tax=Oncorhynchus gorbuscha TaxID=8017 RepID=UPI001EAF8A97|nr:uncharacterized protein LOC124046936 [Oncorhynchus gorbuscha]